MAPKNDRSKKEPHHRRVENRAKQRPGLPAESSILEVKKFTSPKGRKYRILKTDEKDPYDDDDKH